MDRRRSGVSAAAADAIEGDTRAAAAEEAAADAAAVGETDSHGLTVACPTGVVACRRGDTLATTGALPAAGAVKAAGAVVAGERLEACRPLSR
jgi:hypothetical protein